jgi:hypothetical protein
MPAIEQLLAEERADADAAVSAYERRVPVYTSPEQLAADFGPTTAIAEEASATLKTSEERACPAPGDLSPAESSAEPAFSCEHCEDRGCSLCVISVWDVVGGYL